MIELNTSTGTIIVDKLDSVNFRDNRDSFYIYNNAEKDSHACIDVGYSRNELYARHWISGQDIHVDLAHQHGVRGVSITPEMRERVKRRYGTMVDATGIRPIPNPTGGVFDFEMGLSFRKQFSIHDMGKRLGGISQFHENVVESAMHEMCDKVEKIVFSRKPDEFPEHPAIKQIDVGVSVSHNVMDDLIITSPKTYHKILDCLVWR